MRCACLLLCVVFGCTTSWGQESVHQQLYRVAQLEQQGQYSKVVESIPPLIGSNLLDQGEVGRAWVMLGFAYEENRDFMQAESSYEHAIQIFSHDSKYEEDYATTLDNFADFYRDIGDLKLATTIEKKALAIYRKLNNHASAARACVNLAGISLRENHRRQAQDYLSQAMQEAKLGGKLEDDFLASFSSMRGWLAELHGDKEVTVSEYQQALDLWRRKYGEEHMMTGWGYMLLGNAYARAGKESIGLEMMRKGLDILEHTLGNSSSKYLAGEIAYARALDHAGEHDEAHRLKKTAEQELARLSQNQCLNCRVSVAAFH